MKWTCTTLVLWMFAFVVLTVEALSQSRTETLIVVTELGPNTMDIHGVGANRPAYQASWNLYDRLMTFGTKTLPDGTKMYDCSVLKPELAESWQIAPDNDSKLFRLLKRAGLHLEGRKPADAHCPVERPLDILGRHGRAIVELYILAEPEGDGQTDDDRYRHRQVRHRQLVLPDKVYPEGEVVYR